MKNINIVLFTLLAFLSSCDYNQNAVILDKMFGGKHELRKFNVKTSSMSETHACFFLLIGSYSQKTIAKTNVRFYFKNYRGEFQFYEMPIYKVNIKIDNTVEYPYMMFLYGDDPSLLNLRIRDTYEDYELAFSRRIVSATIFCKDSDFQPEIDINGLR